MTDRVVRTSGFTNPAHNGLYRATVSIADAWWLFQRPARIALYECERPLRFADNIRRGFGLRPRWSIL